MKQQSTQWLGRKPAKATSWACADTAMVLDDPAHRDAIFRMYRRYVKQWNDIELDPIRRAAHTHDICGAQVRGGDRRFILQAHQENKDHWILEIHFARTFSEWYPKWSFGKNTLRSRSDIKKIHLHWSNRGKELFEAWLSKERKENQLKGEWTDYQGDEWPRQASYEVQTTAD